MAGPSGACGIIHAGSFTSVTSTRIAMSAAPSLKILLLMTRPGFLVATLVACLLGMAVAVTLGHAINPLTATSTILLALIAHASANVLNDYHDALNGADEINTERIFPFTGGARFIQDGVVSINITRRYALLLLAALVPAGLWLSAVTSPALIVIGIAGLAIGWTYSAPPLQLMSRGLGEPAIALAWSLVVVGAACVQTQALEPLAVMASAGFALLLANILMINGFPDAASDALAGKRTLVVRLGPDKGALCYLLLAMLAHLWLVVLVGRALLPPSCLVALLSLPLSLSAARRLWLQRREPSSLRAAIVLTIAAAVVHGLALSAGLMLR